MRAQRVITIDYAPRVWAAHFHQSFKRFAALVLHRRAGKSVGIVNHLQRACLDDDWEMQRLRYLNPHLSETQLTPLLRDRHYAHIFPTAVQARLVAWDKYKRYSEGLGAKTNETEMSVRYPKGEHGSHKVQLFGADEPDRLRGPAFSGAAFDEYGLQPRNVYSEVVSKALADHLGFAIFAGTVKGTDALYQTYEVAQSDSSWFALWQDIDKSLATESGATIEMLRQAMEDDRQQVINGLMTQDEFDQEWYLSVTAAIKGAYYAKEMSAARQQGRITNVPVDPTLPVDTAWDLGVGDHTAIWFSQSLRSGEVRLVDYYENSGEGLPHYVAVLKQRGYLYGRHVAPHDIQVREFSSGLSRLETAAQLGLKFEIAPDVSLDDGIHAVRMLLPRCWFDNTRCKVGLDGLLHYRKAFNRSMQEFTPRPVHDLYSHCADAFRYKAVSYALPKNLERERREEYRTKEQVEHGWMRG